MPHDPNNLKRRMPAKLLATACTECRRATDHDRCSHVECPKRGRTSWMPSPTPHRARPRLYEEPFEQE